MAYNEELAQRVRTLMENKPTFAEKKMFGGLCFLLQGHMACGVLNDELIIRVAPKDYEDSLQLPNTRKFTVMGQTLKDSVMVSSEGYDSNENLSEWIERGSTFTMTLPPK